MKDIEEIIRNQDINAFMEMVSSNADGKNPHNLISEAKSPQSQK